MSKHNSNNNNQNRRNNNQNGKGNSMQDMLFEQAKLFAKSTLKSYKKKYKKDPWKEDWSKKKWEKEFFRAQMEVFPDAVEWCLRYAHQNRPDYPEVKESIYGHLIIPEFTERFIKSMEKGDGYEKTEYLPILIKEILIMASEANRKRLKEDPQAVIVPLDDIIEMSKLCMGKRLKKFVKKGIDEEIAFNVLSVIPTKDALQYSKNYRVHNFYETIYDASKGKDVPFEDIMDLIVERNDYPSFMIYALLERKDKYANLSNNQKKVYMQITNWVFGNMEDMDREQISSILRAFVAGRKQDEGRGKDTARRFALSTLSDVDYPKIVKCIKSMIMDDESIKKYF